MGSEYFDTLEAAVEHLKTKDASSDYTIVMHKNASGTGATISGIINEVAINFNNHVYTLTGSNSITVSGCSVELKKMNMSSGTVNVENNATVSITGSSAFSGIISVTDSSLIITSISEVTIDVLTVDSADLTLNDNVIIKDVSAQDGDDSKINNIFLNGITNRDPMTIALWRTDVLVGPLFHTGTADYQYTYKAEFSFPTSTTGKLDVLYLDNAEWKTFGTLTGTYEKKGDWKGKVWWEEGVRSYYYWVAYEIAIGHVGDAYTYILTLTDPEGGEMTFIEVINE